MNITSYMPVDVVSGKDCVENNAEKLLQFGKKCLIVTGGNSAEKCGALKDAIAALEKCGIEYSIFNEITQNPYTADCHRAGECARKLGADFIFGIGGGSPLDASKAVAIYSANPNMKAEEIYTRKNINKPLPLVLLGTTAGTGSEVTGVAVLTDSTCDKKKSISGHDCYSALSFCDYTYTLTVPYDFTVSTMLDAFAHATESYFSAVANEISDLYAEKAFKMLKTGFQYFLNNKTLPHESLREELYNASLFAGLCLNITGTCFPHTMGYLMTEDWGIPHGKACAAFTPELLRISAVHKAEKANNLFEIMGMSCEKLCNAIESLANINVKITADKMAEYENRWFDPVKNFSRTPGDFTADTAVNLLKKLYF